MDKAPVVVFAYNRPNHLFNTLSLLNENIFSDQTDLFIFCDGSKSHKDNDKIQEVREITQKFIENNKFKQVKCYYSEKNKGLANSVIEGVSSIIDKYGKVIVVEDDLETSNNFLKYMNDCLEFYQENDEIWSISGYTFPLKAFEDYDEDIYLSYRASSWGWATWKDRWQTIDWQIKDYQSFKYDFKMRKKFNRGGKDLSFMLDCQMVNRIDSWAIRWCYNQMKQDKYTIYPKCSKVKNKGLDGSGTHSGVDKQYFTDINISPYTLKNIQFNDKIIQEFRNNYSSSILANIKLFILNR